MHAERDVVPDVPDDGGDHPVDVHDVVGGVEIALPPRPELVDDVEVVDRRDLKADGDPHDRHEGRQPEALDDVATIVEVLGGALPSPAHRRQHRVHAEAVSQRHEACPQQHQALHDVPAVLDQQDAPIHARDEHERQHLSELRLVPDEQRDVRREDDAPQHPQLGRRGEPVEQREVVRLRLLEDDPVRQHADVREHVGPRGRAPEQVADQEPAEEDAREAERPAVERQVGVLEEAPRLTQVLEEPRGKLFCCGTARLGHVCGIIDRSSPWPPRSKRAKVRSWSRRPTRRPKSDPT